MKPEYPGISKFFPAGVAGVVEVFPFEGDFFFGRMRRAASSIDFGKAVAIRSLEGGNAD